MLAFNDRLLVSDSETEKEKMVSQPPPLHLSSGTSSEEDGKIATPAKKTRRYVALPFLHCALKISRFSNEEDKPNNIEHTVLFCVELGTNRKLIQQEKMGFLRNLGIVCFFTRTPSELFTSKSFALSASSLVHK